MHEEVELDHDPKCEGDVAHEIVYKLKVVYACVAGQERCSYAQNQQGQVFGFMPVDVNSTDVESVVFELITHVAIY